ncbi:MULTISPECIES: dihydrolipoamide acetyltransferase family protein [Psychrilyobacter]|uniref:Dihydrolipoamide acetyltransferase component of pyruvate dehydrogenase complex n=1 Tax=Psychrilyobacter piezotolerans TaxID=2293438 RepID=A0ABX9KIF0_9FUSO|nr:MULTISPECIES: dihydrolipoamide acetyltransferase family protein [Psychrilyobacter]MCS5422870.1 2-oxo acid dehydrogenase subunit E2 [Psychrilyobacter sp. S5]NDI77559.1 2-oxo acid dehydrogenase subunit E2 [Psychrilyobacter piezotolerans]RDE62930.1 2-oxo acid dehydrogenase subunit E2 [Psychrilyobacter sp. S5]REI41688.1 2-oxo acid dehydrogenase subunit E2 [Psychrilyobacter piezotolerans]
MFEFKFADIGEGIHQGKVLDCFFKIGDMVEEGESLFLVETDKVNAEIPSPAKGIITAINFEINDIINVGDVVVVIDDGSSAEVIETITEEKEKAEAETEEGKGASVVGEVTVSNELIPGFHTEEKEEKVIRRKSLATPIARRMAKDLEVDINEVEGSGLNGRVMKEDIQKFHNLNNKAETTKSVVLENGDDIREEMSLVRKAIFKTVSISKKEIPHTTLFDDIDLEQLVKLRGELSEEIGVKLTYMPFIMKAVYLGIKKYPVFNSTIDGEEIVYKKQVNLGVAVDTDYGLVVPVLKDLSSLSIIEISEKLKGLSSRARDKKLSMEDITGGTFTVSNFGKFAKAGTPIIKHPEVAVLGIGRVKKQAVIIDSEIQIRSILPVSLSVDHRIIDGADGGRFIEEVRSYLENPKLLLLS